MDPHSEMSRRSFIAVGSAVLGATGLTGTVQAVDQVKPDLPEAVSPTLQKSDVPFRAVRFKVDVTPPVGAQMAYVINEKVEYPIYVSGIIFEDGKTRVVWASCDFIYICGETVLKWKSAIGQAAGVSPDNVFLHSVHQHDSMFVAPEFNPKPGENGKITIDPKYCEETLTKIVQAVKAAVTGTWTPIIRISTAEQRIGGLASGRRLLDKNGKAVTRWSSCRDTAIRNMPIGTIDPILRTICFEKLDGDKFVALHFYTTHPMAAYLRKMVGPDVPGWAIRVMSKKMPDTLHVYFTGCAGDITMGKYNTTGDTKAIEVLGNRLADALDRNMNLLIPHSTAEIKLVRSFVDVPFDMTRIKADSSDPHRAYMYRTLDKWKKATITRMSIGTSIHAMSIGLGEVCVPYQLYAQSLVPEEFLAVAAYANGIYQYMPAAIAFQEGGYESSEIACSVLPAIESNLKKAIAEVLADLVNERPYPEIK